MFAAELEMSQRHCEADQQRLWNDLSAHIASIHSRHPSVAPGSSSDSAVTQWSQLLTEGHLTSLHTAGLSPNLHSYSSYSGRQSRLADVYSTTNKAGQFPCFLSLFFFADNKFVTVVLM